MVFSPNLLHLFYHMFPTDNSMSMLAKSAVHNKPPVKEFHKDLLSCLCFSMFLLKYLVICYKLHD